MALQKLVTKNEEYFSRCLGFQLFQKCFLTRLGTTEVSPGTLEDFTVKSSNWIAVRKLRGERDPHPCTFKQTHTHYQQNRFQSTHVTYTPTN